MNYILDDDFVILGGNDNSDGHPSIGGYREKSAYRCRFVGIL